jgi:hypothetical protein
MLEPRPVRIMVIIPVTGSEKLGDTIIGRREVT